MSSIVTNGQIKVTNLWKREGLFYYSIVQVFNGNLKLIGTVTRRLDFVSYHLIKWIHGEEVLRDMAYKHTIL